ncbi:unnamed protein product, partial [Urochloa humidicola]
LSSPLLSSPPSPAHRPSRCYSTSTPLSPPLASHWRCEEQRRGEVLRRRMANNTAAGADASSGRAALASAARAAPASVALANLTPVGADSADPAPAGGATVAPASVVSTGVASEDPAPAGGATAALAGEAARTSSRTMNCQTCSERIRITLNLKGFRVLCCTRKKLHEWKQCFREGDGRLFQYMETRLSMIEQKLYLKKANAL